MTDIQKNSTTEEQELAERDRAEGRYGRLMREVDRIRNERRKVISSLAGRVQSIEERDGSIVNRFDPVGIESPLQRLLELQKELEAAVEQANEAANKFGRSAIRFTYATFIGL